MRSYWVKYIERDGAQARRLVVASSAAEARRIASEDGCEDVTSVRRAHFLRRMMVRIAVTALAVAAVVAVLRYFRNLI